MHLESATDAVKRTGNERSIFISAVEPEALNKEQRTEDHEPNDHLKRGDDWLGLPPHPSELVCWKPKISSHLVLLQSAALQRSWTKECPRVHVKGEGWRGGARGFARQKNFVARRSPGVAGNERSLHTSCQHLSNQRPCPEDHVRQNVSVSHSPQNTINDAEALKGQIPSVKGHNVATADGVHWKAKCKGLRQQHLSMSL